MAGAELGVSAGLDDDAAPDDDKTFAAMGVAKTIGTVGDPS